MTVEQLMDALQTSKADAEGEWNVFLATLKPWELHYVCTRGRELDWHDDFVNGVADFDVFRAMLDAYFKALDRSPQPEPV